MRAAPEAMRMLDRHLDRRHELAMQNLEFKFTQELGSVRGADTGVVPFVSESELQALREGYIRESTIEARKRFPFVDLATALVRPTVTWIFTGLYVVAKLVLRQPYSETDMQLFSYILAFWFVGRVWDRQK